MAYFNDADEVYRFIGKVFVDLAQDEELTPRLRRADTIVRYRFRNPDSQITVKLMKGEEAKVDLGETDMEAEVVMSMDADTAHRFWLGKLDVPVALARGQIDAEGPVEKIVRLIPLVRPVFPRYAKLLEEAGRADLMETA